MYLALAKSTQTHDRITLLIDLMFIIASLLSALLARYVVKRIVVKGLRPLDMLNAQLKQVNISSDAKKIELNGSIVELTPIVDSINQFIEVNSQLYRREKQLTSDIAHELKTPISELLNLVEVHQKFPNDKQLSESFDQELLIIAQRMKGLVDNMLLFQRSQLFGRVVEQKALDLVQLIQTVVYRKLKVYDSVDRLCCQFHQPCLPVLVPPFALETIVRNLLVNALCHGDPSSPVVLRTMAVDGGIELQIENKFSGALSKDEMAQMFDPLWRKDKSRSSSENHGLGLSIVKSFCDQCDYVLTVEKPEADLLRFSLVIPTT
jgi:signal transduction histidine kinase